MYAIKAIVLSVFVCLCLALPLQAQQPVMEAALGVAETSHAPVRSQTHGAPGVSWMVGMGAVLFILARRLA